MRTFGWSLPPGCGSVPGDEPMPPCCEECPDEIYDNCPGEDKCEMFQKMMRDEAATNQSMYEDYISHNVKEVSDEHNI